MKKILVSFIIGILIGAAILFLINNKWPLVNLIDNKGEAPGIQSDDSGFSSVTSELETGGDLFLYLNTKKFFNTIKKSLDTLKETLISSDNMPETDKKEAEKWFNFMTGIIYDSGLFEISGIGLSSKDYKKGLTRSKFVLHHRPGKGKGLIWNISNDEPDNLQSIDFLPSETVFSSFSNFSYSKLWNWIKFHAEKSSDKDIREGINSIEPGLKNSGIDLQGLLKSIKGDTGIIIALDKKDSKSITMANKNLHIPNPAIALVIKTSDESIFKLLSEKIPEAKITEKGGKKTISVKTPQMPITFSPTIVQKENTLIIASNLQIIEKIYDAENGKNRLKDSEEFKTLSEGMPEKGSCFTFLSSTLFKEIMKGLNEMNPEKRPGPGSKMEILKKLGFSFENLSMMRITQSTEKGHIITTNTTIRTELLMILPAVAVGGIIAAVAIPAFVKKRETGKQKLTMSNMRLLGTAIEAYMVDYGHLPEGDSIKDISSKLIPSYLKKIPQDGWGNDLIYMKNSKKEHFLGSAGGDLLFKGWEQRGFYKKESPGFLNNDIVMKNGTFVYGPETN